MRADCDLRDEWFGDASGRTLRRHRYPSLYKTLSTRCPVFRTRGDDETGPHPFWGAWGSRLHSRIFGRATDRFLDAELGTVPELTIPLLAVFVPYFAFRAWLYGDLFPNTYYAKSGALTYFRQGGVYLIVFLAGTGGLLWLPLWILSFFQRTTSHSARVLKLFSFFSVLIFGTYVAKVGGDFMEHRFLLVLLPIVFATTEIVIRQHGHERRMPRWLVVCGVLGLAWVGTRFEVIKPYQKKWHLAAEHTWYRVESVFPLEIGSRYFRIGKGLKKALGDVQPPPRIAYPCVGLVGFYSELPLVDTYGLVNRNIARKPLKKRGRPGHEKRASLAEVIKEGAVLSYERYAPKGMNRYLEVKLGGTGLFAR